MHDSTKAAVKLILRSTYKNKVYEIKPNSQNQGIDYTKYTEFCDRLINTFESLKCETAQNPEKPENNNLVNARNFIKRREKNY